MWGTVWYCHKLTHCGHDHNISFPPGNVCWQRGRSNKVMCGMWALDTQLSSPSTLVFAMNSASEQQTTEGWLMGVQNLSTCKVIWYVCVSAHSVVSNSLWPHGLQPTRLLCPWDFPSKNTGVGCYFLLQGIFPTQGSNPCLLCLLLHWQVGSLPLSHLGKPQLICMSPKSWYAILKDFETSYPIIASSCISLLPKMSSENMQEIWDRYVIMRNG